MGLLFFHECEILTHERQPCGGVTPIPLSMAWARLLSAASASHPAGFGERIEKMAFVFFLSENILWFVFPRFHTGPSHQIAGCFRDCDDWSVINGNLESLHSPSTRVQVLPQDADGNR